MEGKSCNAAAWAACKMRYFLGLLLLILGVRMLVDYTQTVEFLVSQGNQIGFVPELLSQAVAYSWPVVATLVGLSLLTKFQKCIATTVFYVYLLLFTLTHVWIGDIGGATYDILLVMYMSLMKGLCGIGRMCEK